MKNKFIRFGVIGDCHYSLSGNYSTRNCSGAKEQLEKIIDILNKEKLDFVLSLGDLSDGNTPEEVFEIKKAFEKSTSPVYFVIGNHDLRQRSDKDHAEIVGSTHKPYDFTLNNYRFIVLNAFENSIFSRDEKKQKIYKDYCEGFKGRKFQRWPGVMSDESYRWVEDTLKDAEKKGQEVVFFSHVPVWKDACVRKPGDTEPLARIADHIEFLDLIDGFKNVRAYIAGHYHPGGIGLRRGVLHKTVRSVCDFEKPTACIFTADENGISVKGIGDEFDFSHKYSVEPTYISGTAPEGCYVMTNCGEIQQVGADNCFSLSVPCSGMYSVKAVMDGCQDVIIPWLVAPAEDLKITFTPDPARKLYVGKTNRPAVMEITDNNCPVRWFDISGKNYGEYTPPTPMWTAHSTNYWTNSLYAFTATGDVKVEVMPNHPYLRQAGWYKGDSHNHLFHGEGHYVANPQQSAFIGRAEGYDWLCFSQGYSNDGICKDNYAITESLSDENNLFIINEEFPKNRSNHFAVLGATPTLVEVDMNILTSLESADRYVWQRGGITIPVHPFEGHMSFRQMPLWLNCAPEKMPCIDFYYHPHYPKKYTDDYWFMLLNKGYKIGCFSTSDGAYDVGRTPGSGRGATYVKAKSLKETDIVEGIKNGRTMVSYDYAALLFWIDENISGDILYPDGKDRILKIKAFWKKGKTGYIRIVRNGEDIKKFPVTFSDDEVPVDFEMPISENENGWYVAFLEREDGQPLAVASPIYFRNEEFSAPKVIPMPKNIPETMMQMFEDLESDDLARPELIDEVAVMLEELNENKGL